MTENIVVNAINTLLSSAIQSQATLATARPCNIIRV